MEAVITLPDGRRAKLTGPSREAIEAKARELIGGLQPEPGGVLAASGALQRGPGGQVVGNTADPPPAPPRQLTGAGTAAQRGLLESVAGNVAGLPKALLQGSGLLSDPNIGMPPGVQKPGIPALNVPQPSGPEALAGILGGARSAGNMLQGQPANLGQNFQASLAESQRSAQENPTATAIGGAGGDALSILMGRAPMTRMGASRAPGATTDIIAPRLKPILEKAFRSEAAEKLAKIAGRSLEAGFEGASLAMLQDGDPLETGSYAAASQVAGLAGLKLSQISGVTDLFQGKLIKGGTKLGATAFAVGSLIQFLKSATPGGKDFILESIESGFDKIPLALALGTLSGLTGAGRIKGGEVPIIKANLPGVVMDAFSTLPRGAVISVLKSVSEDETGDSEKTIRTIIANPSAFTGEQLKRLDAALEKGGFSEAVREMAEDEKFRAIIDAPDPRLVGVPMKEDDDGQ